MYEWCSNENNSGDLIVSDGEIDILQLENDEVVFSYPPIITLENANLHSCEGKWRENVLYTIHEVID